MPSSPPDRSARRLRGPVLGAAVAAVVLAVAAIAWRGGGLAVLFDETPSPPAAAPPIALVCDDWRSAATTDVLGSLTSVDAGSDFRADGRLDCWAVSRSASGETAGEVQLAVTSYRPDIPLDDVDVMRLKYLDECPGTDRAPAELYGEVACTAPATSLGKVAWWSGMKGRFTVDVHIRYPETRGLPALAKRLGTTPDALLTDTAGQLGRAALARL